MALDKDRFFIPRTLRVGYQNRPGTYTGMLAYIIYIDQTNKVRKETSWKSWRDDKIEPNDFENVPTEGFVLNKHVGGYKSDWNFRQSYCRIYDPRGFEFEITIDNLLWILDWEDCMHGKGLTGKFVYGWIYDQLYLIPCATDDYKISKELSDKMFNDANLKKDELVPGASYKIKTEDHPLVYIGNLKLQKFLGKSYKSALYFYDADPKPYYKDRINKLIRIDKSSILCKVTDDVLDKETVEDLIYRFNISAYSHNFWNTSNIVKEFVTDKEFVTTLHKWYWKSSDNGPRCGFISEDGKSITLVKHYITKEEDPTRRSFYYSYRYYIDKYNHYKFITLNADMTYTKFNDVGRQKESDYRSEMEFINSKHDDPKDLQLVSNKIPDIAMYVTNDGYVSDSIARILLKDESLSYIDEMSGDVTKEITLPRKINKETNN